jgi:hypothetical protein
MDAALGLGSTMQWMDAAAFLNLLMHQGLAKGRGFVES